MIAVTVHGAAGRMGRLVTGLIDDTEGLQLAALVDAPGHDLPAGVVHPTRPVAGQEHLAEVHPAGGVIVDFSLASALTGLLAGAAATGAPLVIGTTGYEAQQLAAIAAHARVAPVVHAANFSVGIPVLNAMLRRAAELLPDRYQAEQIETHHRHKLDRPSGTALALARTWEQERGLEQGVTPIHSLRLGGVTGEHHWIVADDEEILEIRHTALTRRAFLRGIVPAIRFVADAAPGLYGMEDVLAAG